MNGELDRQIVGQTDRKHEISVAAITGESEASARDVRLTKCHSDHLKVKDKHTQSGAEKQKVESRVSLSNLFQISIFKDLQVLLVFVAFLKQQ